MVKYKLKLGNSPASQAPRISLTAYRPPILTMKPEKIVTSDQTMHRPVITKRGVSFLRRRAQGVSKLT